MLCIFKMMMMEPTKWLIYRHTFSAQLDFDYQRTSIEAGESVGIYVSGNATGGACATDPATWSLIAVIPDGSDATMQKPTRP